MKPDNQRAKKPAKRKIQKTQERKRADARRQVVSVEKINLEREVEYIVELARARDVRVVVIGELVLFSTASGDAWMLDTQHETALCLARDGERQAVHLVETPTQFGIDWDATYTIDGEAFRVRQRSGRVAVIRGYPLAEIQQAIARHAQLLARTTGATRPV